MTQSCIIYLKFFSLDKNLTKPALCIIEIFNFCQCGKDFNAFINTGLNLIFLGYEFHYKWEWVAELVKTFSWKKTFSGNIVRFIAYPPRIEAGLWHSQTLHTNNVRVQATLVVRDNLQVRGKNNTIKHFCVRKIMQIRQNGPLNKYLCILAFPELQHMV